MITVGNQSAGKSSVIEMMVGKQFLPRGKGIKTRCPIHVRMHQRRELDATEEYAVLRKDSSNPNDQTFKDFDEVCAEIEKRTDKRTNGKNISNEEILLDIYSPNYPDLQFVDLPGFTKIALDQQDKDIEQQVLGLNLPFMKDPSTIILAIQDATQDLASSEALKHALDDKVDPNGDRTIGVLTKLDNLNSGSDRRSVAEILQNKSKALKLGYIGIVNRTQDEIDNNAGPEKSKENERRTLDQLEFQKLKSSVGIDVLRQRIIKILAEKVKKLIPSLKQKTEEELEAIRSELEEHRLDNADDVDPDDQIATLLESTIGKIRINLVGLDVRVASEELNTGFIINEKIKKGANEASRAARTQDSIETFHKTLVENLQKSRAIRDNIFPDQLVLEIGVGMLTENYRIPFKNLLQDTTKVLTDNIIKALEATLGAFPHFKDLVQDILLDDLKANKAKAEEYLDMLVDIHKRFINSEHPKFAKVSQGIRSGDEIRYKNHFNNWFKDEGQNYAENYAENFAENYAEKLQTSAAEGVHTNKFPSGISKEAKLHIDLCLEYMEIVDDALVDAVPKIFVIMLVMKTIDFLCGSNKDRPYS